jgi:hypothetical protein
MPIGSPELKCRVPFESMLAGYGAIRPRHASLENRASRISRWRLAVL